MIATIAPTLLLLIPPRRGLMLTTFAHTRLLMIITNLHPILYYCMNSFTRYSCSPEALFDAPVIRKINTTKTDNSLEEVAVGPPSLSPTSPRRFAFPRLSSTFLDFPDGPLPSSPSLKRDLQRFAKQSEWLIIATDNDREGENIGFEIIEQCTAGTDGDKPPQDC